MMDNEFQSCHIMVVGHKMTKNTSAWTETIIETAKGDNAER